MLYKIPVATSAIQKGDMIMHCGKPMYIVDPSNLTAIDIINSEQKIIVPIVNMFGFNYVTKVVSLMNISDIGTPSPDQPFGNIMPLMLMSQFFGDDNNGGFENMDMGKLMMFSMLTGQQNPFTQMFNLNPQTPQN